MRDIFLRTIHEDLTPLYPQVTAETLLIWGARDEETPLQNGEAMRVMIPRSRLEVFAEGTHWVYREYPDEVSRLVESFGR